MGAASKFIWFIMSVKLISWIVESIIPLGSGPSRKQIDKGSLNVAVIGLDGKGANCKGYIKCSIEPGYLGTAIILAEASMYLLHQRTEGEFKLRNGGVLTAASGLGSGFMKNLEKHGFEFKMESIVPKVNHSQPPK